MNGRDWPDPLRRARRWWETRQGYRALAELPRTWRSTMSDTDPDTHTDPDTRSEIPEFTTRPKTEITEDGVTTDPADPPPYRCRLDGFELVARKPKDALIAQLAPVQSRRTPNSLKVQLALNFLGDCLEEPGRSYLETRLLDARDDLDAPDVMPILTAIAEHWMSYAKANKKRR
jgi:hypothetical protein